VNRVERPLAKPRVRGEPEVVVRGEVDDRLVIDRGLRLLFVVEDAQPPVQSLFLQRSEFGPEVRERIGAHRNHGSVYGRRPTPDAQPHDLRNNSAQGRIATTM
jgi:hypothetical protein